MTKLELTFIILGSIAFGIWLITKLVIRIQKFFDDFKEDIEHSARSQYDRGIAFYHNEIESRIAKAFEEKLKHFTTHDEVRTIALDCVHPLKFLRGEFVEFEGSFGMNRRRGIVESSKFKTFHRVYKIYTTANEFVEVEEYRLTKMKQPKK